MSIYPEMLIRNVPAERVTDAWIEEISQALYRATADAGARVFPDADGLRPAELEQAGRALDEAFRAHPLYRQYLGSAGTDRDMLEGHIRRDIGRCPEPYKPALARTCFDDEPPGKVHWALSSGFFYAQPGECLLEVNLHGSYYGLDGGRGLSWVPAYFAIAQCLERCIPGCVVWYGADEIYPLKPFGPEQREQLRQHIREREDMPTRLDETDRLRELP